MICPKCATNNDDSEDRCKACEILLKRVDPEKFASFLPTDTPDMGFGVGPSKQTFTHVTGGTDFWEKLTWKGFIGLLLVPLILALLVLLWILTF